MIRLIRVLLLLVLMVCTSGCKKQANEPIEEHYGDAEGSVGFDIVLVAGSASFREPTTWSATYKSSQHVARFKILFDTPRESTSSPISLSFGKGSFAASTGSDPASLIKELKDQLEAKTTPTNVLRVQTLPFEYVILGTNQHSAPHRRVNWTTMKLFLGGDQGEVYLNLNPEQGKAEFSIKDADYGDFVVNELAKVL